MRLAMGAGNMAAYRVFLHPVRPRARSVSLAAVPEILPLHSQRLKQSFPGHLGRCGSSLRLTARPFPAPGLSEPQMKRFYNYGNLASQDGCGILCDRSATVDCKEISCRKPVVNMSHDECDSTRQSKGKVATSPYAYHWIPSALSPPVPTDSVANVARQCDTCGSADTQVSVTFNDQGKQWWVKGCARSEIWGQRPCQVTDAGKISDVIPNFTASVQVVTSPVARRSTHTKAAPPGGMIAWTDPSGPASVRSATDGQTDNVFPAMTLAADDLKNRLKTRAKAGGRLPRAKSCCRACICGAAESGLTRVGQPGSSPIPVRRYIVRKPTAAGRTCSWIAVLLRTAGSVLKENRTLATVESPVLCVRYRQQKDSSKTEAAFLLPDARYGAVKTCQMPVCGEGRQADLRAQAAGVLWFKHTAMWSRGYKTPGRLLWCARGDGINGDMSTLRCAVSVMMLFDRERDKIVPVPVAPGVREILAGFLPAEPTVRWQVYGAVVIWTIPPSRLDVALDLTLSACGYSETCRRRCPSRVGGQTCTVCHGQVPGVSH
ncbi:hypothetical protein Bbelb_408360 [Branchiostoma belcheri]|nr:hypothetical protein Bbelb_408360 [Branchiostoma belcheri]